MLVGRGGTPPTLYPPDPPINYPVDTSNAIMCSWIVLGLIAGFLLLGILTDKKIPVRRRQIIVLLCGPGVWVFVCGMWVMGRLQGPTSQMDSLEKPPEGKD